MSYFVIMMPYCKIASSWKLSGRNCLPVNTVHMQFSAFVCVRVLLGCASGTAAEKDRFA